MYKKMSDGAFTSVCGKPVFNLPNDVFLFILQKCLYKNEKTFISNVYLLLFSKWYFFYSSHLHAFFLFSHLSQVRKFILAARILVIPSK